jgi:hypothetical protein
MIYAEAHKQTKRPREGVAFRFVQIATYRRFEWRDDGKTSGDDLSPKTTPPKRGIYRNMTEQNGIAARREGATCTRSYTSP